MPTYEDVKQRPPEWIHIDSGQSRPGKTTRPQVHYVPEQQEPVERMRVVIDYALSGYWVTRCTRGYIRRIDIPDGRVLDAPGRPRIPTAVFSVALPFGAHFDPAQVEVTQVAQAIVPEPIHLQAIPQPQLEGSELVIEPDAVAFETAGWHPSCAATLSPAPAIDGLSRLVLRAYPLAVEPISGRLLVRSRIRVLLRCAVRNHGLYHPDVIDTASPILNGVLGYRQLVA